MGPTSKPPQSVKVEHHVGTDWGGVALLATIIILVISTAGDPDILDAIVSHLMRTCS